MNWEVNYSVAQNKLCPFCPTGGELRSSVKCIVVTFVTGSLWLLWRYPGEPKTNAQYVAIISRQYLCDTDKYQAIYQ